MTAVSAVLSNKKLTKWKDKKAKVLTLKKDFSVPLCLWLKKSFKRGVRIIQKTAGTAGAEYPISRPAKRDPAGRENIQCPSEAAGRQESGVKEL